MEERKWYVFLLGGRGYKPLVHSGKFCQNIYFFNPWVTMSLLCLQWDHEWNQIHATGLLGDFLKIVPFVTKKTWYEKICCTPIDSYAEFPPSHFPIKICSYWTFLSLTWYVYAQAQTKTIHHYMNYEVWGHRP